MARFMIRTSYQKSIDESLDVKINGLIFRIRVTEESFGSSFLVHNLYNQASCKEVSSDEDEDNDGKGFWKEGEGEDVHNIASEGEGENLPILKTPIIPSSSPVEPPAVDCTGNILRKGVKTGSASSVPISSKQCHSNPEVIVAIASPQEDAWKTIKHMADTGRYQELNKPEQPDNANSIDGSGCSDNTNQDSAAETICRVTKSDEVRKHSSNLLSSEVNRCVYSDRPRAVYDKLTNASNSKAFSLQDNNSLIRKKHDISRSKKIKNSEARLNTFLLPRSMRMQQQLALSLSNRKQHSSVPKLRMAASQGQRLDDDIISTATKGNSYNKEKHSAGLFPRVSSPAPQHSDGSVFHCSSISSADIRNCNARFLKKYEVDAASNLWKEAIELGVAGEEDDGAFINYLLEKAKQDEATRVLREQSNKVNK